MNTNRPAEIYTHGIRRAWLDGNRVALIITSGEASRAATDAWADLMIATLHEWPKQQPVMVIQDLSHPAQTFTPYCRRRLDDIYDALRGDQSMYNAFVTGGGLVNSMISFMLRFQRSSATNLTERVFSTQEDAYSWLVRMTLFDHQVN